LAPGVHAGTARRGQGSQGKHCFLSIVPINVSVNIHSSFYQVGNCDFFMKRKILVINKTKQDEILLKLKVYDPERLHRIP
jgi:hypothetical protein